MVFHSGPREGGLRLGLGACLCSMSGSASGRESEVLAVTFFFSRQVARFET